MCDIFSLLPGAPTPARWSSSSWPCASISSSTSSTPWRLTWRRRACCQRWRRPPPRATRTHSGSPWEGHQRGGQHPRAPCSPGAPGDSPCLCVSENTSEKKNNKTNNKKPQPWVIPFHLGVRVCAHAVCESCFWHQCFQVELVNYCTVTHFHYSQLVSIHTVEQNVGQLYISTCIQDILYIPIDVC